MSTKFTFFLIFAFTFTSCVDSHLEYELAKTQAALKMAQQALESAKSDEEGALIHIVFFKLKPEANSNFMISEIKKLEEIPELKGLKVGSFENLDDPRALSDYSLVMELSFKNKAAYQAYQKHPIHTDLKERTKQYLAGPPLTYDYLNAN